MRHRTHGMRRIYLLIAAVTLAAGAAVAQVPTTIDFEKFSSTAQTGTVSTANAITDGVATFTGGNVLQFASQVSADQTVTYANSSPALFCPACGGFVLGCGSCSAIIQMSFKEKVDSVSFDLINGRSDLFGDGTVTYYAEDDLGHHQEFTLAPDDAGGMTRVEFPYPGIKTINVSFVPPLPTEDPSYRLLIDNVSFYEHTIVLDPPSTEDNHVLIHKSRVDDAYPSARQTADGEIKITATVKAGPQSSAGLMAYFKVLDPPDSAPYVPSASRVAGDNLDPDHSTAGQLTGSGVSPVSGSPGVFSATADSSGIIHLTLKTTAQYAGDNYQIEASLDPDFTCAADCKKTGVFTAWKRIYVEKQRMLRNGIPLSVAAHPGDTTIHIADNHYGGNQGSHGRISKGDRVVLVHGPAIDRSNIAAGRYYEEHNVAAVVHGTNEYIVTLGTKSGNAVTTEALAHDFGPDPSDSSGFLADSVAALAGANLSTADYFDASDDLITGSVFPEAFTEYGMLQTGAPAIVPVPDFGSGSDTQLQRFANKWNSTVGADGHTPPGHQLLLIGDNDRSKDPFAGVTTTVTGQTSSWVWRGTIDTQVATRGTANFGQDPDLWAKKTAAHEMAHEWRTNTIFNLADHCPSTTKTYNDSSLYCLLADNSLGGAETQRANGIARFHMLPLPGGGWHSEYFEIRRRPDPFIP
jgi:hypothetical protein